jgi:hypothetical protein
MRAGQGLANRDHVAPLAFIQPATFLDEIVLHQSA